MADTSGSYKSSNNYIGLNNPQMANKLAERTIDNAVPYIRPVLSSLRPDFLLLDVGCGPGSITINIARDFPRCKILALDEPNALAICRKNIEAAGVTNIHLVAGDALDIQRAASTPGFEALRAGCDVVHTHQVHMHVQDAPRLMRELRATVKPQGGIVCCREGDMGMMIMYPEHPDLARFTDVIPRAMVGRGQDPFVGRKLVSHALKAGFKRSDIEASIGPWLYSTPEERKSLSELFTSGVNDDQYRESMRGLMKEAGVEYIEPEALKKWWQEWVSNEDGWYCMLNSQVVCRRSD